MAGRRCTDAEYTRRIKITESLIVQGRAGNIGEAKSALRDLGIIVSTSTVVLYVNEAKRRLISADDDLRLARREILTRKVIALDTEIASALKRHNVVPTWRDRVECLKLLRDIVGIESAPNAAPPRDPAEFELEKKNEKELDTLLVEMLRKSTSMLECVNDDTVEEQA